MQERMEATAQRLEKTAQRMENARLAEYLAWSRNPGRMMTREFLSGVMRGLGFSMGFTILGAILLNVLRNIALANLPIIGRFLAELVRIVENNL